MLSQGLNHRVNQSSLPPPDLSRCRPPLFFTSNPPSECQRPCGSVVEAAFLRLSLLHSSCSRRLPASAVLSLHHHPSLSLRISLSHPNLPFLLSFTPSLPCFPLHCRSWGNHCGRQISVCCSHKVKDYWLIFLFQLQAFSPSRQVAGPYCILLPLFLLFDGLAIIHHLKAVVYAWQIVFVSV